LITKKYLLPSSEVLIAYAAVSAFINESTASFLHREKESEMDYRKNQANLTSAEKAAFINAVLKLKHQTPSQLHPNDASKHRYDDYVEVHMKAMAQMAQMNMPMPMWAHQGPAFLPWHRVFLRHLEHDLQKIDQSVTLPYWDWTVNNSSDPVSGSPWTDDFMGQKNPNDVMVASGPFRADNWLLVVIDQSPTNPTPNITYLTRTFARPQFAAHVARTRLSALVTTTPSLPTAQQVNGALTEVPYDASPWDSTAQPSFRNRLEGWYGAGYIHNSVHIWVGGTMSRNDSPNDPIFFLHHCNIDRLWTIWQRQHPDVDPYLPQSGGPLGQNLNDTLIFYDATSGDVPPWPDSATPADVLNHHTLGYSYDTDPPVAP
jgi:tyrosinase